MFIEPERMAREEMAMGAPTPPPDPSIPELERSLKLKADRKLIDARAALQTFIDNNPESTRLAEAKKALGEVNTDIFFSTYPSPEKQEYIVQRGDVLLKIASRLKTTPEMIVRSNNMDGIMLHIGDKLLISQPHFSLTISRKEKTVTLFDGANFFKEYKVLTWNVPAPRSPVAATGKVTETIAWKDGKRVAFGNKDYEGSDRWVSLGVPGFTLYTDQGEQKPPSGLGMSADDMEELSTLLHRGVPVTIRSS